MQNAPVPSSLLDYGLLIQLVLLFYQSSMEVYIARGFPTARGWYVVHMEMGIDSTPNVNPRLFRNVLRNEIGFHRPS